MTRLTNNSASPNSVSPLPDTDPASTLKQTVEFLLHHLGPMTLVAINPDTGQVARWIQNASDTCLQWISKRNQKRCNIYFSVNQPQYGLNKKASKGEIEVYRGAFADIDAKAGRTMADCRTVIEQLPLPPSFTIMTGGGYQPIWLLRPTLPASPEHMQRAEAVGKAIAALTQGDPVENIDRILRLPDTVNHPDQKKREAGRTRCMASILDLADPVPDYTIEQLETAFPERLVASSDAPQARRKRANGTRRTSAAANNNPGPKPAHIADNDDLHLNAAAHEGVHSFAELSTERQNAMLAAMLALPAIKALADAPRDEWRPVLWALADAEHRGATEAAPSALAWSKASKQRFEEKDFNKTWQSFDPNRVGGVTIATLIAKARDAGFNTGAWLHEQADDDPTALSQSTTWANIPPIIDAVAAGATFNRLLGFARRLGGEPSYFMRQPDGTVLPIKSGALQSLMASYQVRVGAGKEAKLIPAAKWWSTWYGRYTVDLVAYDPEQIYRQRGVVIENTWRGFAIQPAQGSWALMRQHLLDILCCSHQGYYTYFAQWLAHVVQRPGTSPEIMVVLRSLPEGVGKSLVGIAMTRMLGAHGYIASTAGEVFGEFNEIVDGKTFIMLEENAYPGNHQLAAAMKNIVTAPTLSINPKGRPRYIIPNRLHLLLTSNEEWTVPAGADARRFFVLEVTRKENEAYFERLFAELNNGGAEAMLFDLLQMDLSGFKPRDVPVTPALVRQQRMSADDVTGWVTDAVVTGVIVPEAGGPGAKLMNGGFGATVPGSALYASYCGWTRTQGSRRPKTAIEFGRALKQLGMVRGNSNNPPLWTVPDALTLLANAERRARIRSVTP